MISATRPGSACYPGRRFVFEHIDFQLGCKGNPALKKPFVRQAIAYGIDRKSLTAQLYKALAPGLKTRPERDLSTVPARVQAALAEMGLQPAEGDTPAELPRLPTRQRRNLQLPRAAALLPLRLDRRQPAAGPHVRLDPAPAQTCRDRPRQGFRSPSLVQQVAPERGLGSCAVFLGVGRRSARGGLAGCLGLQRRVQLPGVLQPRR